ncbi:hypothetical protein NLU13_4280 [Sarocladium strictum]|uniref:tRNA (adenine(58)-N(1))-methyltransferase non-catalytic subunit TRM6 n=1 Tax=Sarocladium strictum TaxID=5046 RepID=A0AA39L814_SARSR|nr:hypothetical protein NLU13_4280 [Sarocladium strictum]
MPRNLVRENGWVALRLPNDSVKVLQVVPNTTIALGKYGSFPSNLIIDRPFHLTYEVQDKREGESFSRLRVVPGTELNAAALAETNANEESEDVDADDAVLVPDEGEELTLVDESGKVLVRSKKEILDDTARQTLTADEIEELKRNGTAAGQELIAKLLLSHTALEQKTAYSLAKYKLLKTKKYIRRFTVLPLDISRLAQWQLEERDASKILEIREEMLGLIGCWADVHYAAPPAEGDAESGPHSGRWLMVDDTGGLLVGAMAERMGILHQAPKEDSSWSAEIASKDNETTVPADQASTSKAQLGHERPEASVDEERPRKRRPQASDFDIHYAPNNTITLIHQNPQANLSLLKHYDYDHADPNPTYPYHPLFTNLLPLTWLQLLQPEDDLTYSEDPPDVTAEELASWKTTRRGNYHRKRRRWARTRHIVDQARAGGFCGLAVASTMDPVSILRNTLPLLAGGAPIAIYSPNIEPLSQLMDCFTVARRAAWISEPPPEIQGRSHEELDRWEGSPEFPINPTLLLGATVQTSRAKRWQVLPGRTHPLMTGRGGAEGYLFTGWRAIPVEGKVSARGKFTKKKTET